MISSSTAHYAAHLGVVDALVLRRDDRSRWTHVGGVGRGAQWAGRFSLDGSELRSEQHADSPSTVSRFHHREPVWVLGPHYALAGATVRPTPDVVVVLTNPRTGLAGHASDEALIDLSHTIANDVTTVDIGAQLAAETETLLAVSGITTVGLEDVWSILARSAAVAAQALSCDVAVLRDRSGLIGAISTWGPVNVCDEEVINSALDEVQGLVADGEVRIQDTRLVELPPPLSWEYGIRSLLLIPVPEPVGGLLIAAHTMRSPRGFTDHCLRVGRTIVDTVAMVSSTVQREPASAAA